MTGEQLKERTRQFALDVVDVLMTLGRDDFIEVVRPQLLRAGTGVATNYRAACRSRSGKEFASRLATVVEEVDESELWLDFLQARGYGAFTIVARLRTEAVELRAIFSKSRATTLSRLRERRKERRLRAQ
jgi:four helix bundle protein